MLGNRKPFQDQRRTLGEPRLDQFQGRLFALPKQPRAGANKEEVNPQTQFNAPTRSAQEGHGHRRPDLAHPPA